MKSNVLFMFALTYTYTVDANVFSSKEPFFDRSAFLQGKSKREIKPKHCPDGSNFLYLDIEADPEKPQIDTATCVYIDSETTLSIEHVYENGEKIEEYSLINGLMHGPYVSKYNNNTFFIHRFCEGKISRSEIYDNKGNLKAISLHLDWQSLNIDTTNPPDILIALQDMEMSVGMEKLAAFDESECKIINTNSEKFNEWIDRNWFDLSNLQ